MVTENEMNFCGREHELNDCLRNAGKRQTQANRDTLVDLSEHVKSLLDKQFLNQNDLKDVVQNYSDLFE